MRLAIRWLLACVIPGTLLYIYFSHYSPEAVAQYLPHTSLLDSLRLSDLGFGTSPASSLINFSAIDTSQLWLHWSRIYYDCRPRSRPIALRHSAVAEKVSDYATYRLQPANFVNNAEEDFVSMQQSHARLVDVLKKMDGTQYAFEGKGVVMVGGGEYFGPAIIGIHMLRRTGSTLPVEVFVPNEPEYEPELCEEYLPKLNAKCVVLSKILTQPGLANVQLDISHYQLKIMAVLLSSFAEVLLLDSDSIPLVDPLQSLFNVEPYQSHGLVIWPDFWRSSESPHFWEIAGFTSFPSNLPVTSSEAGQLLINKNTHWPSLVLATYYNVFGPDYYYPLLSQGALGQGDKETFLAAAVVLGQKYYRVRTPVVAVGRNDGYEEKGSAMVQYLPSDDLAKYRSNDETTKVGAAFVHSNTPKMNAGHLVDEGDLFSSDGKTRLRLLGSKEQQLKLFGLDLEDTIWELLVQTGCELASVVREWKERPGLCDRLQAHYREVFEDGKATSRR